MDLGLDLFSLIGYRFRSHGHRDEHLDQTGLIWQILVDLRPDMLKFIRSRSSSWSGPEVKMLTLAENQAKIHLSGLSNEHTEVTNKTIVHGLKTRLEKQKGDW